MCESKSGAQAGLGFEWQWLPEGNISLDLKTLDYFYKWDYGL